MNGILEQINSGGQWFAGFAGAMLVQSSVLIAVLLLVDWLLKKRVRAVIRYWVWMLVLLKLVLPTTLSSPVSIGNWFGDELAEVKISGPETSIIETDIYVTRPATVETVSGADVVKEGPREAQGTEAGGRQVMLVAPKAAVTWQGVVFLVWLVIVGAMGLLLAQRAIFVKGLVAQAKQATGLMKETLKFCCKCVGVKGETGLKVSANATSPAVCGLWRYVILVPQDLGGNVGASGLRAVLMHELAHIKRGDLWVNLVQTLLQIVYFYNPLLWVANFVIRRVREQAVDEAVLVAMGEKAQQYPKTLVNVAKLAFKRPALSLRLIGVVESKSALAGRVKHMLNRPMPKTTKLGILGLVAVLIFGAVLLPMAKAEKTSGQDSVRLVVGRDKMAFQGKEIEWEELPSLLEKVPNRSDTVFEIAITSKKIAYERYDNAKKRADKLVERFGFKELKYVGVHPLKPRRKQSAVKMDVQKRTKQSSSREPMVISSIPSAFADDISADLKNISVTFDRPMMNLSWSWVGGGETFPETTGKPRYDRSKTTCSLPVKLEPGKFYFIGINSPRFKNFQTKMGIAAVPYVILFATQDKNGNPTPIPDNFIEEAKEINSRSEKKDGIIDISIKDFDIRLDEKRGVCNLVVSIQNEGDVTIPKFKLKFYRGNPENNLDETGKVHSGWHEAGPIEPGKSWNERTRDFHLPDGQYEFNVVLDFDDGVPEADENNNRASLKVVVDKERIVEEAMSLSPGFKTEMEVEGAGQTEGDSQVISDKELGGSIRIPADWDIYKNPSPGRYKFSWQLLPPRLKAWAVFIGIERDSKITSVSQVTKADITVLKDFFTDYKVRWNSWTESEIGGLPAAQYAADYKDKEKKMVEYRTYLLGESMVYWFVFRIERDMFVYNKDKFDGIINSFSLDVGAKDEPSPIGKWESVNYVQEIEDFEPGEKLLTGELFLKKLRIMTGGRTSSSFTWKKGLIVHSDGKTKAQYYIKEINGSTYLFLPWLSGDVTIRGQKPWYYVLKKRTPATKGKTKTKLAGTKLMEEQAEKAALDWLKLCDDSDYGESWEQAAELFRKAVSKEQLQSLLGAVRGPLGKMISRKVKSRRYTKQLPGAPDGEYVVIQFETSFENKSSAIETITPVLDKDGIWRVSGYYIK